MTTTRWLDGVSALAAGAWSDMDGGIDHPFVDHAFLAGLEASKCIRPDTGWQPLIPVVERAGKPVATAPAYIKQHSHGEFVFDWAWASAYQQMGLRWYPKLLVASPYTPVSGPRLLGRADDRAAGQALIRALEDQCQAMDLSSAHVNFCRERDAVLLREAGWLERFDWQYHWKNNNYRDFDDFLDALRSKPRKNIRRERKNVMNKGFEFQWVDGNCASPAILDYLHHCYSQHFLLYGNTPMLNRAFFGHVARMFEDRFQACLAMAGGIPRAAAIFWRDSRRLYGRYWGADVEEADLHFEACYYQGINRAIELGLDAFEPGAQGEHKIRRGFLPVRTRSFHHIRDPRFRRAIADWLDQEASALEALRPRLEALSPFPRPEAHRGNA